MLLLFHVALFVSWFCACVLGETRGCSKELCVRFGEELSACKVALVT